MIGQPGVRVEEYGERLLMFPKQVKISESDTNCPMCGHVLWPNVMGDRSKWCPDCNERYYMEDEVKKNVC